MTTAAAIPIQGLNPAPLAGAGVAAANEPDIAGTDSLPLTSR